RKFIQDRRSHPVAPRENHRAKRNRANCPLLSGKRFDATEDRSQNRTACAAQSNTEVMHPKSISRELAQENEDRPGIA
ncbi:MAG TPA: hypothetical protein VJ226_03150, partial [Bradyrhizobium sp.]|nr:hypothetical protein [Bradyrhizobium sp.]